MLELLVTSAIQVRRLKSCMLHVQ